jgi:hypothetical protein
VKHIEDELSRTKGNQLVLISLVDESGKENILGDAFYEHIIVRICHILHLIFMNIGKIFLEFIFRICFIFSKGLQFGNVMTLLQLLDEKNLFREMRFCW